MKFFRPLMLLVSLVLPCCALIAQSTDASLTGLVDDPQKNVIPGVSVTAINTQTGVKTQTVTNNDGQYVLSGLIPGTYRIEVDKQGFKGIIQADLELHTQDILQINFHMAVGSMSETVTVSGGATNDSPAVSMIVDREFVENMPLNGGSFQDLIQLAPGTVSAVPASGLYSVDGQRSDSNNFTVDGVSANLGGVLNFGSNAVSPGAYMAGTIPAQTALGTTQGIASIDTLQEFKIQTSGYTAEFGRSPGGQVQFTTRSGSNSFHGTLFDYLRNTVFDANSYTNNYYSEAKTAEHQNDFGGTFGGPLTIPRIYNGKDKTFYFLSYEGLRLLLPNSETEYNPTTALRDYASPNILPFLMTVPLPNEGNNVDGCTVTDPVTGLTRQNCDGKFYAGYSYPNNLDSYSGRVDHSFGKRFRAFARYADTPSHVSFGLESITSDIVNLHSWTAGLSMTISDALLDELRFNYSHDGEENSKVPAAYDGTVPEASSLLIPAQYAGPGAYGYGNVEISSTRVNVSAFDIEDSGSVQHQYQFVDSLVWTRGTHSIKFGADWRRLTPSYTSQTYVSHFLTTTLANIQSGYANSFYTKQTAPGEPVFDNVSLYAQDHWRIQSRLTVDYGLCWDFNPPPGPSNGHYAVTLTSANLSTAMLTNGGTQPYQTDYHSFAPRIGFAWNAIPAQHHAVTLRGGFGIFFDTAQQTIGAAYQGAYPFSVQSATSTQVALPFSSSALTPPSLSTTLTTPYPGIAGVAYPNVTAPYTEQWNLSLDEAMSQKNTMTLSYVGNVGKKLLFNTDLRSVPGNSNFSSYLEIAGNGSSSNYSALQIQDVGQILNGLDFVGSFTWAHALDNNSTDFLTDYPVYGNSDNDVRRALNFAVNYRSMGIGPDRWTKGLIGGWTLANRFSAQSGYPLSITESFITLTDGDQIMYAPNLVPGVPIYLHGSAANASGNPPYNVGWRLNRAAFACTAPGPTLGATTGPCSGTPTAEGSLGRNYVREPAFWAWNTALQRSFPVYEQVHLNFRIDAFNILNHPNLTSPDTTLSDSTFGELGAYPVTTGATQNGLYAMGAPRSLQFSLKLQF